MTGAPPAFIHSPLFINFERFEVKSRARVEAIAQKVSTICEPLGRRVHAIVNYEGFELDRDIEDAWAEMVSTMVQRYYVSVTRFTTSAFLRAKLGDALAKRSAAPHVFETEQEARAHLKAQSISGSA